MEEQKSLRNQILITALAAIVLGLLFLIMPDVALITIVQILSVVLLLIGAVRLISYFQGGTAKGLKSDLALGVLLVIAALFCFFQAATVVSVIYIVFGFGLIIQGIVKLQVAVELKNAGVPSSWQPLIILALLNMAVGLVALLNPFGVGRTLMIFIGCGMLYGGLTDFAAILMMRR